MRREHVCVQTRADEKVEAGLVPPHGFGLEDGMLRVTGKPRPRTCGDHISTAWRLQRSELDLNLVAGQQVIGIEKLDEVAGGVPQPAIPSRLCSSVRVLDQSDTPLEEPRDNLGAPVGGSIVDDAWLLTTSGRFS